MEVKKGSTVKVHYTGTYENGKVFDSSEGKEPLQFKIGAGTVIKGFEKGVLGMRLNEERMIEVKPEDGYGKILSDLQKEVPNSVFKGADIKEGTMLTLKDPDGQVIRATIIDVRGDKVLIDLNHPLAGKKLNFKIKVIEIL